METIKRENTFEVLDTRHATSLKNILMNARSEEAQHKWINGAEALLQTLDAQQTEFIFCSPIAAWAPLWEALAARAENGNLGTLRYMNCRHELLAVGLAAGYYKATGRAQVALLPVGLGVLNGSMGLRSAHQERTPMVVLSPVSQTYGENPELDPGFEWPATLIDGAGPLRSAEACIKWGSEVKVGNDLERELRRAFYFAESLPRGPTLLSVPFDVLMQENTLFAQTKVTADPVMAPRDTLGEIADKLAKSDNPIIITEYAGRTEQEVKTLVDLAEKVGAPVFEVAIPAFRNFPRTHPLHGKGPVEAVLDQADLVLVAGCTAPWHPPRIPLAKGCKVVVFDEDPMRPRSSYWGYQTDYCIAGDIGRNLSALLEELESRAIPPITDRKERWIKYNRKIKKNWQQDVEVFPNSETMSAPQLFTTLQQFLPEKTIVVDEVIAHHPAMMKWLFEPKPFRQIRGFSGGLGTGIPNALGVKLAEPDNLVVCVIGDGGFQYNPIPACFGFAQQYKVPILIVICNNEGYESQTWNVNKYFPDGAAVRNENYFGGVIEPTPDYSKMACAYGGYGERVVNYNELEPALVRSLREIEQQNFAVLDVRVQA